MSRASTSHSTALLQAPPVWGFPQAACSACIQERCLTLVTHFLTARLLMILAIACGPAQQQSGALGKA